MLQERVYQFFRKHSFLVKFNFLGFVSGAGYFIGAESASIVFPFATESRAYVALFTVLSGEFLSAIFYLFGFFYLFKEDYGSFIKSAPDAVKHMWTNITPIIASQIIFFIAHFYLQSIMHASIAMPISGIAAFITFNIVRNGLYRFYPMPNKLKNKLKIVKKFIKIRKSPGKNG